MSLCWQTRRFFLDLSARPLVMGIVNVTPDSFSDGGRHDEADAALRHCEQLLRDGADILDIGGESTRPGARIPDADEELRRVLPVVRGAVTLGVPVSVDTSSPAVMRAVLDAGADIINDVRALQREGAVEAVAAHAQAGVCLMHMRGEPATMQQFTDYDDVVHAVRDFLRERVALLQAGGVSKDRIVLDPGIGFAKTPEHNWILMQRQRELLVDGVPLLAGWSRKSSLGLLTGRSVGERLVPSVAVALAAVQHGARIVRVHDVRETVDAFKVWAASGLAAVR